MLYGCLVFLRRSEMSSEVLVLSLWSWQFDEITQRQRKECWQLVPRKQHYQFLKNLQGKQNKWDHRNKGKRILRRSQQPKELQKLT